LAASAIASENLNPPTQITQLTATVPRSLPTQPERDRCMLWMKGNSSNCWVRGGVHGKNSEIATNRLDEQELSVLSLHLLQICLVYINTLMIQRVLSEKSWFERMQPEDLRALTPLIWGHVNPYGIFRLDMNERLQLDQ